MAEFTVRNIEDKKIWEEFVLSQDPKSFLHSWNWGETNSLVGKKIFRLGFYYDDKLVGVCLAIKEAAKRGPHLVIPGGPLIDWSNNRIVNFFLQCVKELARKERVWFVRIRPEVPDNGQNRELFRDLGFIYSPMHLHAENTWILDITKDEEELLRGMRKTTRYMIRKSLTLDFTFEYSVDPALSKILSSLQETTAKRHKFISFPEELFKAQLETFGKDDQARLYICRQAKQVMVAAIIIFYADTAYYHHSASSDEARDVPASYFLQWQIIREAKLLGIKYYNFWGIAPTDDPRHRFAGVTIFKKGFGGRRVDWLHAHDLPISPLYWTTFVFETGRRIFRRL